jgi:hypothetical protein
MQQAKSRARKTCRMGILTRIVSNAHSRSTRQPLPQLMTTGLFSKQNLRPFSKFMMATQQVTVHLLFQGPPKSALMFARQPAKVQLVASASSSPSTQGERARYSVKVQPTAQGHGLLHQRQRRSAYAIPIYN